MSLRNLLGEIVHHSDYITRRSFLASYPPHHRDLGLESWERHVEEPDTKMLPKRIPNSDLDLVKKLSSRLRTFIDSELVHHQRQRKYRTVDIEDIHRVMDQLHAIFAKYGDLCGKPVPHPYAISDLSDWERVFNEPWLTTEDSEPVSPRRGS